jgi:hypothetical protein
MFGLYGMEIILRHYCHIPGIQQAFYALAMAMRICSDVKLFRKKWRTAKALFDVFIANTAAQWGDNFVSLAIHQLRHIPEEGVRHNKTCDCLSCFKCGNVLGKIKKCVRSKNHPLKTFGRFLSGQSSFVSRAGRASPIKKFPKPMKKIPGYNNRFSVLQFRNFRLSANRRADSFFGARGSVRRFKYVEVDQKTGFLTIVSTPFEKNEPAYFVYGANGEIIDSLETARVAKISQEGPADLLTVDHVAQKYMVHDLFGSMIAYPLLHATN